MTADVNVTEKVARAEAKRREPLQWRESVEWRDGFVAGVLWHSERLAAPEVLAGIAEVLREHTESEGDASFLPSCRCGWVGSSRMAWVADLARHQATALADWIRGTDDPDTPVTVYEEEET